MEMIPRIACAPPGWMTLCEPITRWRRLIASCANDAGTMGTAHLRELMRNGKADNFELRGDSVTKLVDCKAFY